MKGLFVSLLLAASVPAEAATFVWSGRPETFEHFAGPAPDELWAYSWYNEAELPPSPFYAAVKLGEFRGSNAEMSGLVGIWQYPTVTTTNRLNGQYVFLGSVESVAGPYAKKREVWLVLDSSVVMPDKFDPQNALVCLPATLPMASSADCDVSSVPAIFIAYWALGT